MTTTPFSFHCMICFEEFHHEDRYPVVLPCGHTYVCHICAERLDKCMECRTPLYTIEKRDGKSSPVNKVYVPYSRRGNAASKQPSDMKKPVPPVKKRLPLPKNVVLLSLIEATELASEGARKKFQATPPKNLDGAIQAEEGSPSFESADSKETTAEDEEERIKMSTTLALGKSGTYAVAASDGLEIFSSREYVKDDASTTQTDDVESMVRHFHLDQATDEEVRELARLPSSIVNENARLQYGDRVQIVSIDGGWAKLARGYGFVKADKQLVKVGGSVDMACKLEAMLRFLSKQRKDLRIAQSKLDNQFIQVLNELQVSLKKNEDLTVICGDTFNSSGECATSPIKTPDAKPIDPNVARVPTSSGSDDSDDYSFSKPGKKVERDPTSGRNRFMCFANGFLENDEGESTLPTLTLLPSNSLMASLPWSDSTDSNSSPTQTARGFSTARPSESELLAGAQAWRQRHGLEPSVGTDFRTGMSGHNGLSRGNEYLGHCKNSAGFPRMSSHTGLSVRSPSYRMKRSALSSRSAHGGFTSSRSAHTHSSRGIANAYTLPYSPQRRAASDALHNLGSL